MLDAAIHFYPGHGESLQYEWPESGDAPIPESHILEVAFEVIDTFCPGILKPMAAVMELTGVTEWGSTLKPEVRPARAKRILQAPLPAWVGLNERFSNHDRREVPVITRQALLDWMQAGLREPAPDDAHHVSWSKLTFPAARARLWGPPSLLEKDVLELDSELGTMNVPVERDAEEVWVSGPLKRLIDQPPIELSISRPFGALFVDLSIHWSLWTQEGSPGKAAIDAALSHLQTRGWEREPYE